MADKYHFRTLDSNEIKAWQSRIELAEDGLRKRVEKWDECIKRYANRYLDPVLEDEGGQVSVNVLLSNVRTKLPFLFYQDAEITVRAERPGISDEKLALNRALHLYWFRLNKTRQKINRVVMDGLLQSYGCMKLGYSTRTIRTTDKPKTSSEKPYYGKPGRKPGKESSGTDNNPPLRVVSEGIVHSRVSPRRILTHPDATFPIDEGCRWIAHKVVRSIDLVRIDERLDPEWRKKLKASETLSDKSDMGPLVMGEQIEDPSMEFVVLYEIWDNVRREVLLFAKDNWDNGDARNQEWPFEFMAEYPFVFYVPLEIPESFEAMTELDPIINQVEEMDHFRTMQLRFLERYRRFYEVWSENVDHDELDKLRIREDGDYILNNSKDGTPAIRPVDHPAIPMDSFRFIADIRNDIDVVSAVSELRRQGSSSADTATEASIIEETQRTRTTFDRQVVDDFVREVVEKQQSIMEQFLPEDLAVEVIGPLGSQWKGNISPKEIEGKYSYTIVPYSTAAPNQKLLRAEIISLVSLMSAPQFMDMVDWKEVLRMILNTYSELTRNGSVQKILRAPEAIQGPVMPRDLSGAPMPPPGVIPMMRGGGGVG